VLRLSLHPQGLAPRIANISQWRAHLLDRLRHQCAVTDDGVLSFVSTTTLFGTPRDVTLSELAIEALFPADPQTAALLQKSHAKLSH
jgi:hypothetical protein